VRRQNNCVSCRVPFRLVVSAVCALYTGRVALAAMVSVGEWLGVEYTNRGVARVLSTKIKNTLVEAYEAEMWSLDDVPSWKEMDESLLDESCKMIVQALLRSDLRGHGDGFQGRGARKGLGLSAGGDQHGEDEV
jgi:hypothetical protein